MKSIKLFAKGFNYTQDGPGNRLVYHLCGCNMHCPWCANPEGIDFHREDKAFRTLSYAEILEEISHRLFSRILSVVWILHDGPGIRTTVFLKECPQQRVWCHNPEEISSSCRSFDIKFTLCLGSTDCGTVR